MHARCLLLAWPQPLAYSAILGSCGLKVNVDILVRSHRGQKLYCVCGVPLSQSKHCNRKGGNIRGGARPTCHILTDAAVAPLAPLDPLGKLDAVAQVGRMGQVGQGFLLDVQGRS